MQRAALLLLASPGLMPTVGFAEAVSPSTGETLLNANGAHRDDCALPRMPSGAGLQEKDTLDAHLHADETKTGKIVGDFDPVRHVTTVSGVIAHGDSLSGPGPVLAKGVGYAVSGYAMWNMGIGGTALIRRSVDRK
jgi:hypothetical protein